MPLSNPLNQVVQRATCRPSLLPSSAYPTKRHLALAHTSSASVQLTLATTSSPTRLSRDVLQHRGFVELTLFTFVRLTFTFSLRCIILPFLTTTSLRFGLPTAKDKCRLETDIDSRM